MRKKLKFAAAAMLALAMIAAGSGIEEGAKASAAGNRYYIGGMTAGFTLSAGGAQVIGLSEVATEEGLFSPAAEAGIKAGDLIAAIDGIRVKTIEELNAALERSGGKEVRVVIKRDGESAEVVVCPKKEKKSGKYKMGVLIRDELSGIGTVTYVKCDTLRFGSLGHAVTDGKDSFEIADTKVYACSVIGVNKGTRGKAGELRGLFLNDRPLAKAELVCPTGLYGTFSKDYDFSHTESVEAAPMSAATIGKAVIYSTVDGVLPQEYEVSIVKVDAGNRDNKNFVLKITDERLIEETGGIVQGMSGSPILQNGKLIGAVTHVFLNDPTRGYGIGIEKMLEN